MQGQTSNPHIPPDSTRLLTSYALDAGHRRLIGVLIGVSFFCCHPVFAKEEESNVERIVEELFLGLVVYPQERGEFQFSTGFRSAHKKTDDFRLETFIEYGITDRLQIAAEFPVDFLRAEPEKIQGLGNVELETYYNFYNNPRCGRAYGVGFVLGLPTATPEVGERAMIYESFFVAYQEFKPFYFNFFAGIDVEDSLIAEEESQVGGDIALAVFRKYDQFVLDLELGIKIEEGETPVRLAPALYWHPRDWKDTEFAVSLPIGLTGETPNLGVLLMITKEFGGG